MWGPTPQSPPDRQLCTASNTDYFGYLPVVLRPRIPKLIVRHTTTDFSGMYKMDQLAQGVFYFHLQEDLKIQFLQQFLRPK